MSHVLKTSDITLYTTVRGLILGLEMDQHISTMTTTRSEKHGVPDIARYDLRTEGLHIRPKRHRHTGPGICFGEPPGRSLKRRKTSDSLAEHCPSRYLCGCGVYTCRGNDVIHQWGPSHLAWLKRTHEEQICYDWVDTVINDGFIWLGY